MLRSIDPEWLDVTGGYKALAAVESAILLGVPIASRGLASLQAVNPTHGVKQHADLFEIHGHIVGDDVGGAMDATLNVYHCPDGDYDLKSAEPYATQAIATSGGTAPEADLITNGTFAADTDWSKGVGWAITGGEAVCSTPLGQRSDLSQAITIAANSQYLLEYTHADNFAINIDMLAYIGTQLIERSTLTNRTVTRQVLFTRASDGGDDRIIFGGQAAANKIDNVKLTKVVPFHFSYVGTAEQCGTGVTFGLLPGADMTNTFWRAWIRRLTEV
jgi:hypothetical protein